MKIIVNKNCGRIAFFRDLLDIYSSMKEMKQESTFLVFVFLWAQPTRVGRIGSRVVVKERTSWEGGQAGTGAGPQGALLSREKRWKEERKATPPLHHSLSPFPKIG